MLFRQAMVALASTATDAGPSPLEGLRPEALLAGVRVAQGAGLLESLDWLSPAAAAAALYRLAGALPVGNEQREIGRRVLSLALSGNAEVVGAVATAMALTGGKGLSTAPMRARLALLGGAVGRATTARALPRVVTRREPRAASFRRPDRPARRLAALSAPRGRLPAGRSPASCTPSAPSRRTRSATPWAACSPTASRSSGATWPRRAACSPRGSTTA